MAAYLYRWQRPSLAVQRVEVDQHAGIGVLGLQRGTRSIEDGVRHATNLLFDLGGGYAWEELSGLIITLRWLGHLDRRAYFTDPCLLFVVVC